MKIFESIDQLLPCEIRKIVQQHKRVKARVETLRRKKIRVRKQWRTA
jgi:hypothetical protein